MPPGVPRVRAPLACQEVSKARARRPRCRQSGSSPTTRACVPTSLPGGSTTRTAWCTSATGQLAAFAATTLLGPAGVHPGTTGRLVATGATDEQVPAPASDEDVVAPHALEVVAPPVPEHHVVETT